MAIVINLLNTTATDLLSGTTQVYEAAYEDSWNPMMYYTISINPNVTKTFPITFSKTGNLKGLVLAARFYGSHFEKNTVSRVDITLQEDVSGTWTDRLSTSITSEEWFTKEEKPKFNFQSYIYIEFDSTYAIDTDDNKWRFSIKNNRIEGNDAAYFYMARNKNTAGEEIFIPILDSTKTYDPSTDLLINNNIIDWNESATLEGVPALAGWHAIGNNTRRFSILTTTTKVNEPHPQIIVRPKTGDVELELKLGGNIHMAPSYRKGKASFQVGTEDLPIDKDKKVFILGHNHSSSYLGMFSTAYISNFNSHSRYSFFGYKFQQNHFRAVMSESHHKNDTEIKIRGDYSHWEVDDRIQTTFPRYAIAYGYSDYQRQEVKRITSISYDSGTNVTTVGIDTALNYYYDYSYYLNDPHSRVITITENDAPYYVYNIDKSANVYVREEDGGYSKSATSSHKINLYNYFRGFTAKMAGVLFEDFYKTYFYGGSYVFKDDRETQYFENVFFHNVYEPIKLEQQKAVISIKNCGTFTATLGGTTNFISSVYSRGTILESNFAYKASSLFYSAYASNIVIKNNIAESINFIALNAGTSNVLIENNTHRLGIRSILYTAIAGNVVGNNNKYVYINYHSNYTINNNYNTAVHDIEKEKISGRADFNNDNVIYTQTYVRAFPGSAINLNLKNPTVQTTVVGATKLLENFNEHLDLANGTRISFENYNGDSLNEVWWANGKSIGEGTIPDVSWKIYPYNEEFTMQYKKESIAMVVNEPISVTVGLEINDSDYWNNNFMLPTVEIKGLGMNEATIITQAEAKLGLQYLTVTGVPKYTGYFDIIVKTNSDANDSSVSVHTIYVNTQKPRVTADLNIPYRGDSIDIIFAETITGTGVWGANKNADYGADSFGNLVSNNLDSKISEIPQKVWEYANRTLTSFGTLIADMWNYATRTLTGKVDIGKVNGVNVSSINDFKDKNTELEIHNYLDSYTNKDDWKGEGMNENTLHQGLDSYVNKQNWKADVTNLDVPVSSRSSHTPQDVWNNSSRTLTDKNGFTLTDAEKDRIADKILNKNIDCDES